MRFGRLTNRITNSIDPAKTIRDQVILADGLNYEAISSNDFNWCDAPAQYTLLSGIYVPDPIERVYPVKIGHLYGVLCPARAIYMPQATFKSAILKAREINLFRGTYEGQAVPEGRVVYIGGPPKEEEENI